KALVTARMASPWNVSPAPRRRLFTSCLKERSIASSECMRPRPCGRVALLVAGALFRSADAAFALDQTRISLYQFIANARSPSKRRKDCTAREGAMTKVFAAVAALVFAATTAHAEVKIGSVLSVSGPASFLGDPEKKTLEMYVADINAAGGINGEKVKLFIYDDGGDANKGRTFATRLVEEDKVDAVVGGSITGTSLAMRDLYEDAGIPFIALAGAAEIVVPVHKWVFKTPHTEPMSCGKIFEDLKKRNLTKIGMISGTDGWGKAMRAECIRMAPQAGITVLTDESYGAADSDMTPQLTNIKATPGVEAVINCGFGQGPAIVTRNYRQLGITVPLYQSHGVSSKSYIQLAGAAAEGVRLPAAA